MKELKVNAIKNGTVIDHIESGTVFKILEILNLKDLDEEILLGTNLVSKKGDTKGVLKIGEKFFDEYEINKIAILSPNATINIIKDYNVVKKEKVQIPDKICKILKCFNPNCITNHEDIDTKFTVIDKEKLSFKCFYCEKINFKENMILR